MYFGLWHRLLCEGGASWTAFTFVADEHDAAAVFGDAHGMVLHTGGPSNVSQHDHLHRPSLLPLQRALSVSCPCLDVLSILVDGPWRLVSGGIIAARQRDEEKREQRRQGDNDAQHGGEDAAVRLGVVEHGSVGRS